MTPERENHTDDEVTYQPEGFMAQHLTSALISNCTEAKTPDSNQKKCCVFCALINVQIFHTD